MSITNLAPSNRNFGKVFQDDGLFPNLNVFENVAFDLKSKNISPDKIGSKVAASLSLVKLEGFEERRVEELSGASASS